MPPPTSADGEPDDPPWGWPILPPPGAVAAPDPAWRTAGLRSPGAPGAPGREKIERPEAVPESHDSGGDSDGEPGSSQRHAEGGLGMLVDRTVEALPDRVTEILVAAAADVALFPGAGRLVEVGFKAWHVMQSAGALLSDQAVLSMPVAQVLPGVDFYISLPLGSRTEADQPAVAGFLAPETPSFTGAGHWRSRSPRCRTGRPGGRWRRDRGTAP